MELRGDFSSYAEVLDLLQIVGIGKKTGEVLLNSNGESISLQLKDGKVINFKTNVQFLEELRERIGKGEISLSEAVKFILHYVAMWDKGRFSFLEREVKAEPIGEIDTIAVMMDFTKEQDEMGEKLKEFFKKDSAFELSESLSEPVTIDPESWRLLSLLSKGNSLVKAVFRGADSFKSGLEKIYTLKEKGLIRETKEVPEPVVKAEEKEKETSFVNPEVFERIRELLVEAMGPMGEFLIEETLEDMEISKLPINMIDVFIENLIERIPDTCLFEGESCKDKLKNEIRLLLKGGSDGT